MKDSQQRIIIGPQASNGEAATTPPNLEELFAGVAWPDDGTTIPDYTRPQQVEGVLLYDATDGRRAGVYLTDPANPRGRVVGG